MHRHGVHRPRERDLRGPESDSSAAEEHQWNLHSQRQADDDGQRFRPEPGTRSGLRVCPLEHIHQRRSLPVLTTARVRPVIRATSFEQRHESNVIRATSLEHVIRATSLEQCHSSNVIRATSDVRTRGVAIERRTIQTAPYTTRLLAHVFWKSNSTFFTAHYTVSKTSNTKHQTQITGKRVLHFLDFSMSK